MNQRTFLGLTHNPFSPPREGFFSGADRKTHLDHLRHLSQWSRRVLVVTGPFGIGKSTLFKELSATLEANTKGARLSGSVVTSEREVLMGLLQGFGIGGELDGHADDLGALICAHAAEQEAHGRTCMVMVDDAHLLEAAALQRMVSLVADSPVRVVLFGEASVVSNLNRAARKYELEWFEIRLTGLPKIEVRDYLEWRFRQAQYRGLLPFTDEQLDKIVSRSGGNPSVIDSMANRLLADMESGEIRKQGSSFPVRHGVLAAVLVLMVGLIYLYVQTEPDVDTVAVNNLDADVVQASVPESAPSPEDRSSTLAEVEGRSEIEERALTDLEPVVAEEAGLNEPLGTSDLEPALGVIDAADEPMQEVAQAAPAQALVGQAQAEEKAEAEAEIEAEIEAEEPAQVQVEQQAQEQAAEKAIELPVDPSPVAVVESVPSQPPANSDALIPASAVDAAYRKADWILAQDGERFTMQLLSLSSLERAEAFINRQSDPGEFALYRMARDGRQLFVVTYGLFSSRNAAADTARGFTGELAGIEPWIRPLRLVQDTVRANAQN